MWRLSMTGLRRGPHITRYVMHRRLETVGRSFPSHGGKVLAISRSTGLCDVLGLHPESVTEANFPEHNLLSLKFPDEAFDFVLSDQVLEHIEGSPQQAIDESWRVLRAGGIAVHTTCWYGDSAGSSIVMGGGTSRRGYWYEMACAGMASLMRPGIRCTEQR